MVMAPRRSLKVADEVWIVAALLHREAPSRKDFTVAEIVARARAERLSPTLRPGVYVHAIQHCVANRAPNPGRYRMLVETGRNRRRLFRPGDPYDPRREGARSMPRRDEVPARYHALLDWYESRYRRRERPCGETDSLLALRGSGHRLWAAEPADQYVARLREGWP